MYVAGKVQKIVRNGETVTVQPGDPVPECTSWPTFKACLNTGFIVWQPPFAGAKPPKGLPEHAVVGSASDNRVDDDDGDDEEKVRIAPVAATKREKRAKIEKETKRARA